MVPAPAAELFRSTAALADAVEELARSRWARVHGDWLGAWQKLIPGLSIAISAAQARAAMDASDAAGQIIDGYGLTPGAAVNAAGFAGWMQPDLSPVQSSLDDALALAPVITARSAAGSAEARLAAGSQIVGTLARTAVSNAARMATSARITGSRYVDGVFWEPAPYCQRCAVILGKHFAYGHDWARHPRCDGQVVPAPESGGPEIDGPDVNDISDLTGAQKQAIDDGADLNQVINSQTGVRGGSRSPRSPLYGNGTKTYAGAGRAKKGEPRKVRLTPKGIYQMAGDNRDMAVDLLRKYGYLA